MIRTRSGGRGTLFFLYLIFGSYFLNYGFNFIKIPDSFSAIGRWIIFFGGVLLIFSAVRYLRSRRYY